MTYCIFKEQICKAVEGLLREQQPDISVETESFVRNNGVIKDTMVFRKANLKEAPAVCLEDVYREYQKGKCLEELADRICRIYRDCQGGSGFEPEKFLDYAQAGQRIIFRLINREKNRELLEEVPYLPFLDLAVVFCYLTEEKFHGSGTILIRREHLRWWKVDADRLWEDAFRNTPGLCGAELLIMDDVMRNLVCFRGLEGKTASMYILTNRQQCYGAAVILYSDVLKNFGERFGKDFYVLPSSVHEVLLIPEEDWMDLESFHQMVREVNQAAVTEEEILADHAYFYKRDVGLQYL